MVFGANLLKLYLPLVLWVGLGIFLGRHLPSGILDRLGKFLFWIGVPISIIAFLQQTQLSGTVWVAPAIAWVAILLGAGLGWGWICLSNAHACKFGQGLHPKASQGSFLLAAMVGNTGYLGYPIILTLVGPEYFAWALFYDLLGTMLGAYGLGVIVAARFSQATSTKWQLLQALLINPGLASFGVGLGLRAIALPPFLERGLILCAWTMLALSLLLMGMRLSQIHSWKSLRQGAVSLSIKMLIVPLLVGLLLPLIGITGVPQLVIVLQMAMPPAFATLVIAEAYDLDRNMAVSTLAAGSGAILVTLPLWLWLFHT